MNPTGAQLCAAAAGTIAAPFVAWTVLSLNGQHPEGLAVAMTMFLLIFSLPYVFGMLFTSVLLAHWLATKLRWARVLSYLLVPSLAPAILFLVKWLLIFRVPPRVLADEPEYAALLAQVFATAAAPGLLTGLIMLALALRSPAKS